MSEEQQKTDAPEVDGQESAPEAAAVETGDLSLEAQLAQAQQEAAEAKEQALRAVAEAQNVRRRAEKEVENARTFARENFPTALPGDVDTQERPVPAAVAGCRYH